MQKQSTIKNRYASFVVSAALGLGILAPGCLVYASDAASTEAVEESASTAVVAGDAAVGADATGADGAETSPVADGSRESGSSSTEEADAGAAATSDDSSSASAAGAGETSGTTSSSGAAAAAEATEATEATVTISGSYADSQTCTLADGANIGSVYQPEYTEVRQQVGYVTYSFDLLPSEFKNTATGEVYTLAEFQALTPTGDASYEITNYTRKVTVTYYSIDGRTEPSDYVFSGNLTVTNKATGEVVYDEALPALTYVDVPAQNTDGSNSSARIGIATVVLYLDHLDDEGNVITYTRNSDEFGSKTTTTLISKNEAMTLNSYDLLRYLVPYWYTISVSDATASNPVATSVDVTYTTFGDAGTELGQTLTYERTSTSTVKAKVAVKVSWQKSSYKDFTKTVGDSSSTGQSITYPYLTVISRSLNEAGSYDVYGVSNVSVEPAAMDGYQVFVTGDGLTADTVYNIAYYREIQMSYDFGAGTGEADSVTVLQGLPLSQVISELPTPTAPDGYSFDGWKVNGTGSVIDTDYTPSSTSAFTLVASYSKIEEEVTEPESTGETEESGGGSETGSGEVTSPADGDGGSESSAGTAETGGSGSTEETEEAGGSVENAGAESAAATVSVALDDSTFGSSTLTVEEGATIGSVYQPEYTEVRLNTGGIYFTYNLLPSEFKNTVTGEVYTLAEFQALTPTGDASYEITNYTRKIPVSFYTVDGRVNPVDYVPTTNLTVKNYGTGEVVYNEAVPVLSFTNLPVQDASGSNDTVRIGATTVVLYLDHLDDSGNIITYSYNNNDFGTGLTCTQLLLSGNMANGAWGTVHYLVPTWYTVSVSDADSSNTVETSVDVTYTTFGDAGTTEGQKLVYERTSTASVASANSTKVTWQDRSYTDYTLTNGDSVKTGQRVFYPYLAVISRTIGTASPVVAYGVSTVSVEPAAMDGYQVFVTGDGLTAESAYNIAYYRELELSFDTGIGGTETGSTETVTVLQGQPLSAVLTELPTASAPEGYVFDGWTVNGEGDVIDLSYVPSSSEAFALVASYSKIDTGGEETEGSTDAGTASGGNSVTSASKDSSSSSKADNSGTQNSASTKELAKTGDMTSALPAVFTALAGAAALAAGAVATAFARLRKRGQ